MLYLWFNQISYKKKYIGTPWIRNTSQNDEVLQKL